MREPAQLKCHQHLGRAILYGNLQEKRPSPESRYTIVRACAVEMQINISQEPLYSEIYRKNAAAQIEPRSRNALHHFTRTTLYRNLQEKCRAPSGHPDHAPAAFTPTVRTPQRGHTVLGKKHLGDLKIVVEHITSPSNTSNERNPFIKKPL